MPTKKDDQNRIDPVTHLRLGQAHCAAPVIVVDQPEGKPAKWRLNSGAVMLTWVGGLGLVALVIDLATARFEADRISMLREHDQWTGPIGRWENLTVEAAGDTAGIYGTPIVYTPDPTKPAEAEMKSLKAGGEVAALIERKHPWQASVTATSAVSDYERVLPGQSTLVNGQSITASDDIHAPPLFIARNSVISEASVCTFGADADTGSVAASRTSTPATEPTMSDRLTALLNRHGDKHAGRIAIALKANKTDDQISVELSDATEADHKAALAAEAAKTAGVQAKLDEATTKLADLQAKLDALKVGDEGEATPPATEGESKNSAPKSVTAGMAILKREGSKLDGFKLRSAALHRWPALRKEIPAAV